MSNDTTDNATVEDSLPMSFPAQVWNKLSRIDVGDFIKTAEVKNKEGRVMYTYQYLTWSWAWATLMKYYPDSEYVVNPEERLENGTVSVNVSITVRDSLQALTRLMWLPVMDPKNNSIPDPTTRQISDARMRCIVKCLAVLGLGLDLWTGTDYPVGVESDPLDKDQFDLLEGLFLNLNEENQAAFTRWLGPLSDLPKKKYDEARKGLESKLQQQAKK